MLIGINSLRRICLFLFVVTMALLVACAEKEQQTITEPAVRPIKLITIAAPDSKQSNRYPAVIDAAQSSSLSFEVGGVVEKVFVKASQEIEKGAIIAQLRQRDFRNQVTSAQAQFKNAEDEYQRALRLSKENAIAKNVLDQRKTQRDVAKSSLDSAKKALDDTVLLAPFNGVIAALPIKELQAIQPGTEAASIIDLTALEASIDMPASVIATVEQRSDKQAFVFLDAAPSKKIEATFKKATLVADTVSQTYKVVFSFTPPEDLLILPGMNATLIAESNADAANINAAIPLAAILSEGNQQYVWLVDNDLMTVSKRLIEVEPGIGNSLRVSKGLSAGETIAGAGAAYLSEGMKVRSWDE
ncbi:MAG: efflux RND transporter periplasmic adaptor subunit [Cellvibrionaceae bacterium]